MQGKMVISLDFELLYGLSDLDNQNAWKEKVIGGRKAIPLILSLFDQYNIHATWATVGMLFAKNKDDLIQHTPSVLPQYKAHNYYLSRIGENETEDPYHFAESLIQKIKKTPNQEIASHTFSHYYCMETSQTKEAFEQDISSAVQIAQENGITIQSIVFPRNQVQESYLPSLKKYNIRAFRGNEFSWAYATEGTENSFLKRIIRFLDAYINITGMKCYTIPQCTLKNGILNIPSSRFLRPFIPKLSFLENLKIARIKGQMRYAAKNGQIFHLWWHPHNFGENTEKNIMNLCKILNYYKSLNIKYQFESISMRELAGEFI